MRKLYRLRWAVIALIALAALWASRRINSRLPEIPHLAIDATLAAPPHVSAIITQHCADCHSEATRWPWYAHVPPASWLLERDVARAKRMLNFSLPLLGQRDPASSISILSAICKAARSGGMPPWRYRLLHPNSALDAADQAWLCQWTQATIPYLQKITAAEARSKNGKATR